MAAAVLLAWAGPAAAGAWTKEKGTGVTIFTGSFTAGTAAFDDDGELVPVPEYRKFELRSYTEYGVTDWLTAILSGEIATEMSGGVIDGSTAAAAGGARLRLVKRDTWVLSTQLVAETGDFDTIGIGVGGDEPGLESRLLFGRGFAVRGIPSYFDAQVGYLHRFGGADEGKLDLTVGFKPTPKWELTLQNFNTLSFAEPDGVAAYRYHKVRAAVQRKIDEDWAVELGGTALVFGENAIREFGVDLSIWRSF